MMTDLENCNHSSAALLPVEAQHPNGHNYLTHPIRTTPLRKQRVTITLPVALLERLRNAVYWKGHGTLAHLIAHSLDEAVALMERANGGPFAVRLAPLKRGRPRHSAAHGHLQPR